MDPFYIYIAKAKHWADRAEKYLAYNGPGGLSDLVKHAIKKADYWLSKAKETL